MFDICITKAARETPAPVGKFDMLYFSRIVATAFSDHEAVEVILTARIAHGLGMKMESQQTSNVSISGSIAKMPLNLKTGPGVPERPSRASRGRQLQQAILS